jgi:uncharacterized protein (DUF2062 family)
VRRAAARFWAAVEGLSPEAVALILTVGLVLGVFPVFGCPTIFCLIAAVILRVNLPAVQLVNQLSSPLQIVLLIPLSRLGARILREPACWTLAGAARDAVAGWLCVCLPLGLVLYLSFIMILRWCRHGWFNGVESSD